MFIYNPNLFQPQKIDKLVSQIDIAPTIFGLLNWSYESKFFGKNMLTMNPDDERAFIGNYQKIGYIKEDKLLILSPQKKVSYYKFDRYSGNLENQSIEENSLSEAISYIQTATFVTKKKLNKWEK
jgi:phosphoglycerol transferase MdoB-like AlkP superfamily enzyme